MALTPEEGGEKLLSHKSFVCRGTFFIWLSDIRQTSHLQLEQQSRKKVLNESWENYGCSAKASRFHLCMHIFSSC